jgi:hypothetical protein
MDAAKWCVNLHILVFTVGSLFHVDPATGGCERGHREYRQGCARAPIPQAFQIQNHIYFPHIDLYACAPPGVPLTVRQLSTTQGVLSDVASKEAG